MGLMCIYNSCACIDECSNKFTFNLSSAGRYSLLFASGTCFDKSKKNEKKREKKLTMIKPLKEKLIFMITYLPQKQLFMTRIYIFYVLHVGVYLDLTIKLRII